MSIRLLHHTILCSGKTLDDIVMMMMVVVYVYVLHVGRSLNGRKKLIKRLSYRGRRRRRGSRRRRRWVVVDVMIHCHAPLFHLVVLVVPSSSSSSLLQDIRVRQLMLGHHGECRTPSVELRRRRGGPRQRGRD